MSKVTQNYEQLAMALGFRFDRERNVIYGLREGFELLVYAADARYPYWLTVTLGARSPMGPLTKEDYKLFVKNEKPVVSLVQEGNLIKITLKNVKKQEQLRDNLSNGIGALLGSVIGVICIIFFSQLGRVAVLSGIVMAVCTLKGYEMLGGKLTKKGVVIGIIMMIFMTYIGDRIDWAILIAREWDVDLFEGFQYVPVLLAEDIIESANYWGNLAMLYIFTIGGAIPTSISIVKDQKKEGEFGQIGSPRM